MSFKLQAAMASGVRSDETKPRRFDLTMSRRTRRPPATTLATSHEQDHHQAVDVEGLGFQPVVVQPKPQDPDGLFCLSDHLQSWQPELDAHQEHETSVQRSEDTKEQASPPQTCCMVEKDDDSEAQQQMEECQDNSRRFSLQELIEDEAVDDGVKDAATGGTGTEENAAAAAAGGGGVREVAEGAAAAGEAKRPDQVAARRVIGMMRRYVKVRSIKPKRASPEKNATPVC
jgi:hypothetical protein